MVDFAWRIGAQSTFVLRAYSLWSDLYKLNSEALGKLHYFVFY